MLRFLQLNRNVRSIRRYRQIISVLAGYGLGHLFEHLNLNQVAAVRRILRKSAPKRAELSAPQRLRLALEELGPTFIKLGQLLSTRADIVPAPFIEELSLLQDSVPSIPFADIKAQIEGELGVPVEARFAWLDPQALAAASIAQVHRARLLTGEDVAVKVRRPGVTEQVETDVDILMGLALLLERHLPSSELYDPVAVVREFACTIRREMDFAREGRSMDRVRDNFKEDPGLYFPRVHWPATAKGVLTCEFVSGVKVNDLAGIEAAGLDRREIAHRGADAFLKMVLEHGFFHADPHPGNVLIQPGNVICLIDFGMMGRLDPALKGYLTELLMAVIKKDVNLLADTIIGSGDAPDTINVASLKKGLADFIDGYYETPLKEIEVGRMLVEFIDLVATHRIKFPPDFTLLVKVLVVVEGMGRVLDPQFDMAGRLRPFLERALWEQRSPLKRFKELEEGADAYFALAKSLPGDLKNLLNKINRNKFRIDLEHRGLERFSKEMDRSANRLSLSMIIVALLIGASIASQTERGPEILGLPALAFLGYAIAAAFGVWWTIAVLRSGRL